MTSEPPVLTPFSSSSDVRVHPLAASPASTLHQSGTGATSSTSSTANGPPSSVDDVTTIFVVGFPDDMSEREFQNMFTFSLGFEAASLKWHCKDQEEDVVAAMVAPQQPQQAPLPPPTSSSSSSSSTNNSNSSITNDINDDNNNHANISANTTNNSAMAGKKQMIGFARFRTRLEALEAVEVLNGKRVDQERGTLLKAEMAKKNLHIKRGSTIPAPTQSSSTVNGGAGSTNAAAQQAQAQAAAAAAAQAAVTADSISSPLSILSKKMQFPHSSTSAGNGGPGYDSFSPLPSDLLSPADYYRTDPFMKDPFHNCSTPTTPVFNDALFGFRSQSLDARNNSTDLGFMSPPRAFGLVPPPRMTKAVQEAASAEVDPFHYLSKSSPVPNERGFSATTPSSSPPPSSSIFGTTAATAAEQQHPTAATAAHQHRMGSLSLHTSNLTEFRSPSISSPSYNSLGSTNSNSGRSFNPADQNPPCNTLYVGNLPPNTSEEELRQLFIKCRAFKRMSFKNKAQGPMCFVEFEDVVYATQAMNDLQGYCLSNSVKGGIRLSFSKNPLFTKPNKDVVIQQPTATTSSLKLLGSPPGIAHHHHHHHHHQREFIGAAFESAANCT